MRRFSPNVARLSGKKDANVQFGSRASHGDPQGVIEWPRDRDGIGGLDLPSSRGDAVCSRTIIPPLAAASLGEAPPFFSLITQPEPSSDQLIPVKVDCIGNPKARLSANAIALLEANQFSEFDSTILQKSDQYPPASHTVVKWLPVANWIESHSASQ